MRSAPINDWHQHDRAEHQVPAGRMSPPLAPALPGVIERLFESVSKDQPPGRARQVFHGRSLFLWLFWPACCDGTSFTQGPRRCTDARGSDSSRRAVQLSVSREARGLHERSCHCRRLSPDGCSDLRGVFSKRDATLVSARHAIQSTWTPPSAVSFTSVDPKCLHLKRFPRAAIVRVRRSDGYLLRALRITPCTFGSYLTFVACGAVRVPHVPEGSLQVAGEAGGITQG